MRERAWAKRSLAREQALGRAAVPTLRERIAAVLNRRRRKTS
jgi:hypothetical protein